MTINEIKILVSIEQVLSSLYGIEVKNRMDCPIHGGDKCFSVQLEYFHCFSCGASGDIFNLVEKLSNTDFLGAKKLICEHFNLKTNFIANKKDYKIQMIQLKQVQQSKQTLKKLRQYQQDRICQVLREIRTEDGNSFLEKHLENLLSRFEQRKEFYITHDIHAHLIAILNKFNQQF